MHPLLCVIFCRTFFTTPYFSTRYFYSALTPLCSADELPFRDGRSSTNQTVVAPVRSHSLSNWCIKISVFKVPRAFIRLTGSITTSMSSTRWSEEHIYIICMYTHTHTPIKKYIYICINTYTHTWTESLKKKSFTPSQSVYRDIKSIIHYKSLITTLYRFIIRVSILDYIIIDYNILFELKVDRYLLIITF